MVIKRGEIWWAELGVPRGSDLGFRHPIIIIQSNDFNQSKLNTIIGVVITSNLRLAAMPGNVLIEKSSTSLLKDSVANVTQIVTLDKGDLLEKVGKLPDRIVQNIEDGLRLVLSL